MKKFKAIILTAGIVFAMSQLFTACANPSNNEKPKEKTLEEIQAEEEAAQKEAAEKEKKKLIQELKSKIVGLNTNSYHITQVNYVNQLVKDNNYNVKITETEIIITELNTSFEDTYAFNDKTIKAIDKSLTSNYFWCKLEDTGRILSFFVEEECEYYNNKPCLYFSSYYYNEDGGYYDDLYFPLEEKNSGSDGGSSSSSITASDFEGITWKYSHEGTGSTTTQNVEFNYGTVKVTTITDSNHSSTTHTNRELSGTYTFSNGKITITYENGGYDVTADYKVSVSSNSLTLKGDDNDTSAISLLGVLFQNTSGTATITFTKD